MVLDDDVGEAAPAAGVPVGVRRHEHARAALRVGAFLAQPLHLPRGLIDPVPPEHGVEPGALVLVLALLGGGERLLLALLAAAEEAEAQVQHILLVDAVVRQRGAVLQLLPREDEPLLVRRDALDVLHLGLHGRHRVRRRLDLQRDRPRQRPHEELHLGPRSL